MQMYNECMKSLILIQFNPTAQHGIELGLKIPTINTNYYSFMGAELKYRRLYSVYLNYVFAY